MIKYLIVLSLKLKNKGEADMQSVTRKAENINQESCTAPTQETSSSSLSIREKVSRIASAIFDYIKSLIPIYSVFHHHKTRGEANNYKEQNDILKERVEKCHSMLADRSETIETLREKNSNLEAKTKTSSTQTRSPRSQHKKEIDSKNKQIEKLQEREEELESKNKWLESDNYFLKLQKNELINGSKNKNLRSEIEELESKVRRLTAENEIHCSLYAKINGILTSKTPIVKPAETQPQADVSHKIEALAKLIQDHEWEAVGEALSPEVHRLVTE